MKKEDGLDFLLHESMIVNEDTGEIITSEQYHKEFSDTLKKQIERYVDSCNSVGQKPKFEYKTIKNITSAFVPVKERHHFNKVFRMDMKNIMLNEKLSEKELAVIGFMQHFVTFPNNDVIFNNEYLTIEEIANLMGMNRNALSKALKTMEQRQILKVITRHRHAPIIYFNPFLIATGRVIGIETYMMFKDTVYNPKDYLDNEE